MVNFIFNTKLLRNNKGLADLENSLQGLSFSFPGEFFPCKPHISSFFYFCFSHQCRIFRPHKIPHPLSHELYTIQDLGLCRSAIPRVLGTNIYQQTCQHSFHENSTIYFCISICFNRFMTRSIQKLSDNQYGVARSVFILSSSLVLTVKLYETRPKCTKLGLERIYVKKKIKKPQPMKILYLIQLMN